MREELNAFFDARKCISKSCIEKEANIPPGTLHHYLKGRRELNKEHITKLTPVLEKYGYKK